MSRGFAKMDPKLQREIASSGGKAAHARGNAHEFTSEEARAAGRKGGATVGSRTGHMAEIGRRGGLARNMKALFVDTRGALGLIEGKKTTHLMEVRVPPDLQGHRVDFNAAFADKGLGTGSYLKLPHQHPDDAKCPVREWPVARIYAPYRIGEDLWVAEPFGYARVINTKTLAERKQLVHRAGYPHADGFGVDTWLNAIDMKRAESRMRVKVTAVELLRARDLTEGDVIAAGYASGQEFIKKNRAIWNENRWLFVIGVVRAR